MRAKFFIVILFFSFIFIQAREIPFNEAQIIAENWTEILEEDFGDQVRVIDGQPIYKDNILVAHVFNLYPKGYVIISPQDYLPVIKMYSLKDNFENNDVFIEDVIFMGNKRVIEKVNSCEIDPLKSAAEINKHKLSTLIGDIESEANADTEEVQPLLKSDWGQSTPYNQYAPYLNGELQALAGCGPVAVSQILNYYEWPNVGKGSESYYDRGSRQTLSTNFEKEYQWWYMNDSYSHITINYTDEEAHAVSTLMFDVAVALHSSFTAYGTSTTSSHYHNIVDHFLYSSDFKSLRWTDINNNETWANIIKNQLDNGWPVKLGIYGYTGAGHAIVVDGYRYENNTILFHLVRGSGSSYNSLSDISSYEDYKSQHILINFYPYPSYTRPIALPPEFVSASALLNRSVFLSEYIISVSWGESKSGDKKVSKYVIYQEIDGEVIQIDFVDPNQKNYEFRSKNLGKISVGVLDKNHSYSEIPTFVTPVLN